MAIVFISPGERQKVFVLAIVGFFIVLIFVVGLAVFLAKPKPVPAEQVFVPKVITINFDLLKSANVRGLTPLPLVEKEFDYEAIDSNGTAKSGKISSPTEASALELLTGLGYKFITIKETEIGRENPFLPYYQLIPAKK